MLAVTEGAEIDILGIDKVLSDHQVRRAPKCTELLLKIRERAGSGRPTKEADRHATPFVSMVFGDLRHGDPG